MLRFAFVTYCTIYCTIVLLGESYQTGDRDTGERSCTYMDAVRSSLGGAKVAFCGVIQYANIVGVAIGMVGIRRANCFHNNGHADRCNSSSTPYMVFFGVMLVPFSQIPDFDQIWWLSIVAAVMSFTYYSIGLSLSIAQTISNGEFMGSLNGISTGAGVTSTQWQTLEVFSDISFAYAYSKILIEIQDNIKAPPSSEWKVMQKALLYGVVHVILFSQMSWLSIVASVMPFTYCSIGLSLDIAQTIPNGGFMGSLTGISIGVSVSVNSTQKICSSSSYVLIEAISSFMLSSACLALAEYMCIWITTMLPPACRIGTRARMPRTGAFKGRSGKCIGRAREAVPAGHSHGIPTFARAGDCSLPPHKCDWFPIMGSTVINTDESCVISASVMCMEAQYRRPNGKYHGANSCFLKVMPEAVESLKDMCEERGAWEPNVGAPTIEGVLEVIRSLKKGILTVYDNVSLRLKSYVTFEAGELSPLEVTSMIQKKGPVIGVLYVDDEAYYRSTVYRGDRASRANHAAVCTGYRYVDGELCIIIMDNEAREGPFRFVLYEAFQEFHVLTVDAS